MIAAALILPCFASTAPPVTYARPSDPQYAAMTHIRRTPAPICEPLASAPLVAGPDVPVALVEAPLVPILPAAPPDAPYSPLAWSPLDWPTDEVCGCAGGWFGGGSIGSGGGYYSQPVYVPTSPIPEPPVWALMLLAALVAAPIIPRRLA